MWLLSFLLLISIVYSQDVCLNLKESGEDPYITNRLYHHIKNLFLEAGFHISCVHSAEKVNLGISYNEAPISVSARQRVSSYILHLKIRLNGKEFRGSVPYSVKASYGEISRRNAVEEVFSRMKLDLLEYILELKRNASSRRNKKDNSRG